MDFNTLHRSPFVRNADKCTAIVTFSQFTVATLEFLMQQNRKMEELRQVVGLLTRPPGIGLLPPVNR